MKTHQKFCVTFKSNKRIKYMYSNRFATFKFGKTNNALLILKINLSARLRLCGRRRQKIERKLPKEIKEARKRLSTREKDIWFPNNRNKMKLVWKYSLQSGESYKKITSFSINSKSEVNTYNIIIRMAEMTTHI